MCCAHTHIGIIMEKRSPPANGLRLLTTLLTFYGLTYASGIHVLVPAKVNAVLGKNITLGCRIEVASASKFKRSSWERRLPSGTSTLAVFHPEWGTSILPDYAKRISFVSPSVRDATITIEGAVFADVGTYTCVVVTFPEGRTQSSTKVDVLVPPHIYQSGIKARDKVLIEGKETQMTCVAMNGNPAASIRWMKGDEELPGKSEVVFTPWNLYYITISRLTFTVSKEDGGVPLTCIVDHPAVKDLRAQIDLKVQLPGAPPRRLEVEAINSTAIRVTWKPPRQWKQQHGQILGYQVIFSRLENGELRGQPNIMDVALPEAQEAIIAGLHSETTYSVTVAAYTTKGDGARSKAKVITTIRAARAKVEVQVEENVEAYLGGSAQIPCLYSFTNVESEPRLVMIQWFVRVSGSSSRIRIFYGDGDHQIVDNNTDYSGRIEVTSDGLESKLSILDVRLQDERDFICQVNGLSAGNAEGRTHLRVFDAPTTTPKPTTASTSTTTISSTTFLPEANQARAKVEVQVEENVEAYLGGSAQIPCLYSFTNVESEPRLVMIQWFVRVSGSSSRIRIFYGDGDHQIVDNNTDYSGRIEVTSDGLESKLSILDVRLQDERDFICQINGLSAGNAEGRTHLRVFDAPTTTPKPTTASTSTTTISSTTFLPEANQGMPSFIKSPEDQTGISGGFASFVCLATGQPKPSITWMKKGKKVSSSSKRLEVIEFDDGWGSVLRIQPLRTHRDEAIYECTASNSAGKVKASAKLTVLEKPPPTTAGPSTTARAQRGDLGTWHRGGPAQSQQQ